jgi:hypothetical protein
MLVYAGSCWLYSIYFSWNYPSKVNLVALQRPESHHAKDLLMKSLTGGQTLNSVDTDPATHTLCWTLAPPNLNVSARMMRACYQKWCWGFGLLFSIGANAPQATLTLNFGGEGVVSDRKGCFIFRASTVQHNSAPISQATSQNWGLVKGFPESRASGSHVKGFSKWLFWGSLNGIANQPDILQKKTNSLLVNVDIPINTKRLFRICLYPSKIDLNEWWVYLNYPTVEMINSTANFRDYACGTCGQSVSHSESLTCNLESWCSYQQLDHEIWGCRALILHKNAIAMLKIRDQICLKCHSQKSLSCFDHFWYSKYVRKHKDINCQTLQYPEDLPECACAWSALAKIPSQVRNVVEGICLATGVQPAEPRLFCSLSLSLSLFLYLYVVRYMVPSFCVSLDTSWRKFRNWTLWRSSALKHYDSKEPMTMMATMRGTQIQEGPVVIPI